MLAVFAVPAAAGAQSTISGRVVAAGTSAPLSDSRVLLVGTSIAATTGADGRYTLRGVPAGTATVQVLRVGYEAQKKTVAVTAGEPATLDFTMAQAVVQLQEIVTTATGDQRKVEIGNSVTTLGDVGAKVETSPINSLSDLLTAKAPGVSVLPGAMTGAGATIRIRGLASLALNGSGVSNSPIYVVDGVRYTSDQLSLGTGGTTASYLNDLNPNEIEDIEIVKGPSAATLYGTDAANGVIVITTKKGKAGATRWNWYGEAGAVDDRNKYPSNYASWGHNATTGKLQRCTLVTQAQGSCVQDSLTTFNVLENSATTPLRIGHRDEYGTNISGGSDAVRFFVSGDLQNEIGPLHMPNFAQATLSDSMGVPLRDEWVNPEAFQQQSFRANISASLSPKFDLNTTAGFSKTNQRLPQVDNNTYSVYYSAWNNPGFNHEGVPGMVYHEHGSLGEFRNGYGGFSPAQTMQVYNQNSTQRFTGSSNASWRPFTWLDNEGTVGIDLADNGFTGICRFAECPNSGTQRQGRVRATLTNDRNMSAKLVSTATWAFRPWMTFKTTVGADYNNLEEDQVNSSGSNLPPGAQTVGQAATRDGGDELQTVNKTLGLYAQEEAALRDRLFLTVAARTDQNSSFGTKFQRVVYPKAQISWLISDEDFFPKYDWLNQLRLRGAYGASGVQPGGTTALRTFAAATANVAAVPGAVSSVDLPGLVANALGNASLRPERAGEFEGGFDADFLSNHLHSEFTYYQSRSHDGIVPEPVSASTGASSLSIVKNLASVQNSGIEANINATLLERRALSWDVTIAASHNSNQILDLGTDPSTGKARTTILVNGSLVTRDSLHMPVNGFYGRPVHFKDADGNGIITPDEVTVDSGYVFLGYSTPRDIFSITNGFDLLNRKLRLTALLDYKGGYTLNNSSGSFYESNFATFAAVNLKSTPLAQQARAVAASSQVKVSSSQPYYENGQFWRLREVSAAWTMPDAVANRLRAREAQIVFTARNLHLWSNYTGIDPEANYFNGDVQTTFSTTGPRTYFVVRANLHY
ncbi:MAG TPA: SusC/RagA family TonB-linked outer membrane protein [Gemmatimonadaceae bacterium]|nr:SusC/RagA family TonB-linked outer membrane protein [Gemmatimonadaceae bacterium]